MISTMRMRLELHVFYHTLRSTQNSSSELVTTQTLNDGGRSLCRAHGQGRG